MKTNTVSHKPISQGNRLNKSPITNNTNLNRSLATSGSFQSPISSKLTTVGLKHLEPYIRHYMACLIQPDTCYITIYDVKFSNVEREILKF